VEGWGGGVGGEVECGEGGLVSGRGGAGGGGVGGRGWGGGPCGLAAGGSGRDGETGEADRHCLGQKPVPQPIRISESQ